MLFIRRYQLIAESDITEQCSLDQQQQNQSHLLRLSYLLQSVLHCQPPTHSELCAPQSVTHP